MSNTFGSVKNTSINLPLDGYVQLTSSSVPTAVSGTGTIYFDSTQNRFLKSENGGSYVSISDRPTGTASGDLSSTFPGPTVISLTGSSGTVSIASTGAILQWVVGTSSPTIKQADNTTNSATGTSLTIQAQNATGTSSIGGALNLTSGTGTSTSGNLNLQSGGTTQLAITSTGLSGSSAPIAFTQALVSTTGGTTTLSSNQYQNPLIVLSGTLASNATIVFPNVAGFWFVSISGLVLSSNTLTFQSGSATSAAISTLTSTSQIFMVITRGGNTIDINQ